MENVNKRIDGHTLTLTVDLNRRLGASKTGKTVVIASTKGNVQVAPGIYVGLNVYTYADNGNGADKPAAAASSARQAFKPSARTRA